MSAPVLVVVTHLLGAGHLTRAAALARTLAAAGHPVTLCSGGMPSPALRLGAARLVQLPPVRVIGTAFGDLRDADGRPATTEHRAARVRALTDLVAALRPALIITELYPFGRRALADEYAALVAAAGRLASPPLLVASIRDALATPHRPGRAAWSEERLAPYDAVLVHGDPAFLPLDASWPVSEAVASRLAYTGYVDEGGTAEPSAQTISAVVVSGGSSAAGLPLQEAALEAARLVPSRPWRVLVGGGVPAQAFAGLAAAAPPNARVERARPDFRAWLAGCAVSISQAGYNTFVDLVRARPRAVIVPFEGGQETEQRLRAEAMARAGLARVLPEAALTGATLAAAVETALDGPHPAAPAIALDGAARTVEAVARLLAKRAA